MGYIYVGPQFRDSKLRTYHFYREIPSEYADNAIYSRLFVAPGDLEKARDQLKVTGSLLHTLYKRAVKLHSQKKEG